MKYPQLVSMPEALRIWLEDELEARGIDTVYSNHILNILQHKNLKDSSIQANEIESLIDELCIKLKKIESEGDRTPQQLLGSCASAPTCSSQNTFSFADPVLKFTDFSFHKFDNSLASTFISSSRNDRKFSRCAFGRNLSNLVVGSKEKHLSSIFKKWEEGNKENQASKENVATKEKMRSRSRSTVKQQNAHKARKNMAKSLDRKDDLLKVKVTLDGSKARKLEIANDPNLSRSILSKFDREVKSIWSPEKPTIDDLDGCDKNLPMDFQQLLESPDNTSLPFEFYKNLNKQINSFAGSFIQCGTNITSSIWSENSGGMDLSMECSGSESLNLNNNNDDLLNNNNSNDKERDCSLSSMSSRSIWDSADEDKGSCATKNTADKKQWSSGENLFPDTPWRMALAYGNVEGFLNLKEAKWSDVEGTSLQINDGGTFYSAFGNGDEVIDTSLSALNHNKEDSCFMEVVPNKLSSFEKYKNSLNSYVGSLEMRSIWESNNEEEDLFTSMRTHFQPISSKEVTEEVVERPILSAPTYEDGTTFQISSSMEKLHFERSDSGALYLDSDKSQKYREFRDHCIEYPGIFLPKFRVCQNEKFCQTEDMSKEEDEEFYFPGDEKQVEDCIERDASSATLITVDGWVAAWPASIWSNDTPHSWCDVWSGEVNGEARKAVQEQYTKLKDEILEEGEELLSDLSSMQDLLLNSDEPASAMHSSQAAALINFSRG